MISERKKINSLTGPVVVHDRQNLEAELILPEYFDSISKILKCTVVPEAEAYTSAADRLSVAGNAVVSLLYIGEDKKIYNYVTELKYTKVLSGSGVSIKDNYYVRQSVSTINYRAIAQKRVDIRCVIDVNMYVVNINEKEYVYALDSDSTYVQRKENNILNIKGIYNKAFSSNLTIACPENEKIKAILRTECYAEIEEKKILTDKIFLRGKCKIELLYITDSNNEIKNLSEYSEFAEVFDAYGITENDDADVFNICCTVKNELNTADNVINSQINTSFSMYVSCNETICFINDAYSVKNELDTEFANIMFFKSKKHCSDKVTVTHIADAFIDDSFVICDSYLDNVRISKINKEDNTVEICGDFYALVKLSDDSLALLSRSFLQEHKLSSDSDSTPEMLDIFIVSAGALRYEERNIKFTADINICYSGNTMCKEKMLTEITEGAEFNSKDQGIILYYADKGETVWSIAKSNRCNMELLRGMNDISQDTIDENKVLIIVNN